MTSNPPPACHPDPSSAYAGDLRWWDGATWTAHAHSVAQPTSVLPPPVHGTRVVRRRLRVPGHRSRPVRRLVQHRARLLAAACGVPPQESPSGERTKRRPRSSPAELTPSRVIRGEVAAGALAARCAPG
ncbi:DUF2510 domain-containing protein [Microbacterium sp.]|uniref:DUF2510 domain-containing protein n=1 Tax=Microbacterium sp. TaxID=51671 RepID=UPI003F95D477